MKLKVCNKKTKLMFPEYRDMIQQLREDNPHFSKMFELSIRKFVYSNKTLSGFIVERLSPSNAKSCSLKISFTGF